MPNLLRAFPRKRNERQKDLVHIFLSPIFLSRLSYLFMVAQKGQPKISCSWLHNQDGIQFQLWQHDGRTAVIPGNGKPFAFRLLDDRLRFLGQTNRDGERADWRDLGDSFGRRIGVRA